MADPRQSSNPAVARIIAQQQAAAVAERMGQYGEQGMQWAQRLQQDPIGGLGAMEAYGGPQQLEFSLANAASQGNAARHAMNILGPEAFAQIQKGRKDEFSSRQGLGSEDARWLAARSDNEFQDFDIQRRFYESAIASAERAAKYGDEKSMGAADFVLVQALGKLVDPNSVVRNEEGKFIQQAGDSNLGEFLHEMRRYFGDNGVMSADARLKLLDQIETVYKAAEKNYRRKYKNITSFSDSLQFKDESSRKLSTLGWINPDQVEPLDFKKLRSVYEKAAGAIKAPAVNRSEGTPRIINASFKGVMRRGYWFRDEDGKKWFREVKE